MSRGQTKRTGHFMVLAHREVRLAIFGLGALLALPLIAFGVYDVVSFQSRHEAIQNLLSSAAQGERELSPTLKRLVKVSGHNQTDIDSGFSCSAGCRWYVGPARH
jgi:hypothetical protein